MTRFKYKAINNNGEVLQAEMEANTPEEVADDLTAKGLTPVNISEKISWPDLAKIFDPAVWRQQFRRPPVRDLKLFFQQLAALFSAGIPLFETLEALEEQVTKEEQKKIIRRLRAEVAGGSSFSAALASQPAVFSKLTVAMTAAGERAGALAEVFKKIAEYLEKEEQLKQKVHAALRYPALVLTALSAAFIFAIIFIIPRFSRIFSAFETKLPLPTRILLGINQAVTSYWLVMLLVGGLTFALFKLYRGTSAGRRQGDALLLRWPVFGQLLTKISLARFFSMLSAMLSSGISLVNGLEITANTADNVVISAAVMKVREKVIAGAALADSLKEEPIFPPAAVHLVASGEKSGALDNMLAKCAVYFDEDTNYIIANLMTLLEPLLVLVMGLLVLLLALGIFLPMWSLMQLYRP